MRKLNRNYAQQILCEDDLESAEYDSLQNQSNVETGVEKSEEKEFHLQAALASSGDDKDAGKEIPAPPAQQSADFDYESLYSLKFDRPATYIRFSQTVEECTGCQYNMSTEDDLFLKSYNQKKPPKCSEDDFEKIMYVLEETAEVQAPYGAVDGTLVPFEMMTLPLKQQLDQKLLVFAKDIYEHWRTRRQESGNHPLQPALKFEKNQEKDDGDPYVCFRRRDVRQTRKTRARDVQSLEKLKKLRRELEDGRQLTESVYRRELVKRDLLTTERGIFEQRATVKECKVRLGIKTDDEDLINQRPQRRKLTDFTQLQRQPGTQLRLPGRSDGRPLEADLILLSEVSAEKENILRSEIESKAVQHRERNKGHIDLTREPLSPVHDQDSEAGFRPATAQYQYLMTPPSSVTSESFDHPSPSQENPENFTFRYSSPPGEDEPQGQPAYRRRIGRGGRLWIDRRGMSSPAKTLDPIVADRWKYDQDDDEEQPVYTMDPYDTKSLRFRATIPFPPHLLPRQRQDERTAQSARGLSGASGSSPVNSRPSAGTQQPLPPSST